MAILDDEVRNVVEIKSLVSVFYVMELNGYICKVCFENLHCIRL